MSNAIRQEPVMEGIQRFHTWVHHHVTGSRRVQVLADQIASLLPRSDSGAPLTVLDIGAGSGEVASLVLQQRNDVVITGVDVFVRQDTAIPVIEFDGEHVPAEDRSYDFVLFVDVLHHTTDPMILLNEARRVARRGVIIKDHNCNSGYTYRLLRFTDWFGNRSYGVNLEYNFWSRPQWLGAFAALGLNERAYRTRFGLYPQWTRIAFPADLDFFSLLEL